MDNWFAGAIVSRTDLRVPCVLLVNHWALEERYAYQGMQVKFTGGSNRDHREDASPLETAKRELFEETGLWVPPDFRTTEEYVIIGKDHTKHFIHIPYSKCFGTLRAFGIADGDTWLGEPYWATITEARSKLFSTHRQALLGSLRFFAGSRYTHLVSA